MNARAASWSWFVAAALNVLAWGAVHWAARPPKPLPLDANGLLFSEERALAVVTSLVQVGARPEGTEAARGGADRLEGWLRAVPGLQVQVETAPICFKAPYWGLALARPRNLLALLPGRTPERLVISAHYDSASVGVGAADNALAVGAVVEVARALAGGPQLDRSVVFVLDEGEEAGLLGAAALASHPWVAGASAFINLDAAGSGGMPMLFQAGPRQVWLAKAYARAAPHPVGTVLAQDLFQRGVVPSDTDFRVYRDEGHLAGLDLALFEDGYSYHTALDRLDRVQPGSLQALGNNVLGAVRALSQAKPTADEVQERAFFFDVLGRVMVAYGERTGRAVAFGTLLLALLAVAFGTRRTGLGAGRLSLAVIAASCVLVAGVGLPVLASLLLQLGVGHPHGWFAHPVLAAIAFLPWTCLACVLCSRVWQRVFDGVSPTSAALTMWAGVLLLLGALLGVMTAANLGSAYLLIAWLLPALVGFSLTVAVPSLLGPALVVSCLPGVLLTAEAGRALLTLFIPLTGRMPSPFALDPLIALLCAWPVALLLLALSAAWMPRPLSPKVAWALGVLGTLGLLVTAFTFPYSAERPKRLDVELREREGRALVLVQTEDGLPLKAVLAPLPGFSPAASVFGEAAYPDTWSSNTEPSGAPTSTLEVLSSTPSEDGRSRTLRLRLRSAAGAEVRLGVPAASFVHWMKQCPLTSAQKGLQTLRVVSPAPEGLELSVTLRGQDAVPLQLDERLWTVTPAVRRILSSLPEWTTSEFVLTRSRAQSL